ncbi:MAG: hypothetical protein J7K85_05870 [Anaerolineaceae bacterium]|nr:hypothetical protein [Anaerolineaceae bacterium]
MPQQSDMNDIIQNETTENSEMTDELIRKISDCVYQLMLRDLEFENHRQGRWNQSLQGDFFDRGGK